MKAKIIIDENSNIHGLSPGTYDLHIENAMHEFSSHSGGVIKLKASVRPPTPPAKFGGREWKFIAFDELTELTPDVLKHVQRVADLGRMPAIQMGRQQGKSVFMEITNRYRRECQEYGSAINDMCKRVKALNTHTNRKGRMVLEFRTFISEDRMMGAKVCHRDNVDLYSVMGEVVRAEGQDIAAALCAVRSLWLKFLEQNYPDYKEPR